MPNFITSNPALPGIKESENRQLQLAQFREQQATATRQDETRRKLASFHATATPQSPSQQALSYAVSTPGAGDMALQLAESQAKDQSGHEDNAMKLLIAGDEEGARVYAKTYNVSSVQSLLEHPTIVREVISFANLADKERPKDVAYRFKFVQSGMAALPQIMGSPNNPQTNPQTGQPYTYQEALPLAQAAAMKEAESVPIFRPGRIQDAEGNWYTPDAAGGAVPMGVKGAKPGARGRGVTPAGNSIYKPYPKPDGRMYATKRQLDAQGRAVTVAIVDEKGDPIYSTEANKLGGQLYLKAADQPGGVSVEEAKAIARQFYPDGPAPVVTRRYDPNKKAFTPVP